MKKGDKIISVGVWSDGTSLRAVKYSPPAVYYTEPITLASMGKIQGTAVCDDGFIVRQIYASEIGSHYFAADDAAGIAAEINADKERILNTIAANIKNSEQWAADYATRALPKYIENNKKEVAFLKGLLAAGAAGIAVLKMRHARGTYEVV